MYIAVELFRVSASIGEPSWMTATCMYQFSERRISRSNVYRFQVNDEVFDGGRNHNSRCVEKMEMLPSRMIAPKTIEGVAGPG